MNEVTIDTKKRIIEAAAYLFGVKGFDGTSTREIGRRAGVNIASLNYHFKSKHNLMEEVASFAIIEFKEKLQKLADEDINSTSEFAIRLFRQFQEEGNKSLNHFKLFLDAESCDGHMGEHPICYDEMNLFFSKDLNPKVPEQEKLWLYNVIFSYLMHTAIMSLTNAGKAHIDKYFPEKGLTSERYLKQLVDSLIRDVNNRYQ